MKALHFLYHELRPGKTAYSYVVPKEEFRAHCAFYTNRDARAPGHLRPEVTFDDGYRSDLLHAAPVLQEFGLSATFFITAGWTGIRQAYLSPQELRELAALGHRIGAHGMTHKLLTQCTAAELAVELGDSKKKLEDTLGRAVTCMSLPGGRANARVLRACQEAGYTEVFTSVPQAVDLDGPRLQIGRLNLQGGTTIEWLGRVLDSSSGVLTRLHRIDRMKGSAKRVLGDTLYARVWGLINRAESDPAALPEEAL